MQHIAHLSIGAAIVVPIGTIANEAQARELAPLRITWTTG